MVPLGVPTHLEPALVRSFESWQRFEQTKRADH
jgi:hypothetical protein